MMQFFKTLIGVKGDQLGRQLVDAIVELDTKAATETQLRVMEQDLDKAGQLLSRLRAECDKERREAVEARTHYNRLLAAAEHLNTRLASAGDDERLTLESSLNNLLTQLESSRDEAEVEEREAVDAEQLVAEAEAAYREKAKALSEAKATLTKAQRDMERARIQEEREQERSERAAQVAGLRAGGASKLNVAVDAMQRRAEQARMNAEAARLKARALTDLSSRSGTSMGDPNIEAALKAVTGGGSTPGLSPSERLAKLTGRPPSAALPPPPKG